MDGLPTGGIEEFCNRIFWVDALSLLRALPDASVDMILTDFPYSITQAFYDKPTLDFVAIGLEMFRVIKRDGAVISTAAQPFTSKLVTTWQKYFRYEWIWRKTRKTNFLNAKKMPLSGHESILVFGHKLPKYYPQMIAGESHKRGKGGHRGTDLYGKFENYGEISGEFYPDTVLEFQHDKEVSSAGANHPNSKPLTLWTYLLNTYTLQGDIVLDPFCGGGVTAIACLNLDRHFICGELHEPYVTMSRDRIQRHDPFQSTVFKNGTKQLSLFDNQKGE